MGVVAPLNMGVVGVRSPLNTGVVGVVAPLNTGVVGVVAPLNTGVVGVVAPLVTFPVEPLDVTAFVSLSAIQIPFEHNSLRRDVSP